MSPAPRNRGSFRLLVIYMISALLFLTSIELHIHTKEAAAFEDHGHAVSISTLANSLDTHMDSDEISVSPDGLLKIQAPGLDIVAIFTLLTLIISFTCGHYFRLLKQRHKRIERPFYGTPTLRAPPQ